MNRRAFLKTTGVIIGSILFPVEISGDTKTEPLCRGISQVDIALIKYRPEIKNEEDKLFTEGLLSVAHQEGYEVTHVIYVNLRVIKLEDSDGRIYVSDCTLIELYGRKGDMPIIGKVAVRDVNNKHKFYINYDFRP